MITLSVIGILIYLYGGWVFYRDIIKHNWNILEVSQNVFDWICSGAFFITTLIGSLLLFAETILLIIKYLP